MPNVLSEDEVAETLRQIDNLKHKCIIYLVYSAGLRVSEVINLQITDIDSKRNLIIIRNAKGKKDRISILSQTVLKLLRKYYKEYKPKKWLFEGQKNGKYSVESVQKIFTKALSKTNIIKKASIHTLRHSFAAHLMGKGTDLNLFKSC